MDLHDDAAPLIQRDPRRFAAIVVTVLLGACALFGIFFGSGPAPSGGGHGSGHGSGHALTGSQTGSSASG